MRKFLTHFLFISFFIPLILLPSCGGDDDIGQSPPQVLVVVEQSTGMLYTVSKITGVRTLLDTVIFNDEALLQLQGMVYNPNDRRLYGFTSQGGDGSLYTIETEEYIATVLNNDPNDDWYGAADLLISSDNQILATLWHKNPTEVGLAMFSSSGVIGQRIAFSNQNICCGLGIVFGNDESEVIISSYGLEIYSSDLNGTVTLLTTLVPEGFDATLADDLHIQNMVKDNENIYAIVYDESLGNTHLAEVDLKNELLIKIGQLNQGNTNRFSALMTVSVSLL